MNKITTLKEEREKKSKKCKKIVFDHTPHTLQLGWVPRRTAKYLELFSHLFFVVKQVKKV